GSVQPPPAKFTSKKLYTPPVCWYPEGSAPLRGHPEAESTVWDPDLGNVAPPIVTRIVGPLFGTLPGIETWNLQVYVPPLPEQLLIVAVIPPGGGVGVGDGVGVGVGDELGLGDGELDGDGDGDELGLGLGDGDGDGDGEGDGVGDGD